LLRGVIPKLPEFGPQMLLRQGSRARKQRVCTAPVKGENTAKHPKTRGKIMVSGRIYTKTALIALIKAVLVPTTR
jgi:hypothetical protein